MIEYAETKAEAISAAQMAMETMCRFDITPHPNNYSVWYLYHSERLPDLSREIDRLKGLGAVFNDALTKSLYDRFIGQNPETQSLAEAGERIEYTLEQLLRMIIATNRKTVAYGATLADLSDQVATADDGTVPNIISTLVSETRKILYINRKMNQELDRSSDEIKRLQVDLNKVREEAKTDGLTGVANRKTFDITLHKATLTAQQNSTFLSLLMLDIDLFKTFNDTYGHPMGDQVLKLVARTITSCVRNEDTVARYGGEEFAVILPETPLREATEVAERIRTTVATKRVTHRRSGDELGRITLSIGISEFALGEPMTLLIQRADRALYQAKNHGRNRVISQLEFDSEPPANCEKPVPNRG